MTKKTLTKEQFMAILDGLPDETKIAIGNDIGYQLIDFLEVTRVQVEYDNDGINHAEAVEEDEEGNETWVFINPLYT